MTADIEKHASYIMSKEKNTFWRRMDKVVLHKEATIVKLATKTTANIVNIFRETL